VERPPWCRIHLGIRLFFKFFVSGLPGSICCRSPLVLYLVVSFIRLFVSYNWTAEVTPVMGVTIVVPSPATPCVRAIGSSMHTVYMHLVELLYSTTSRVVSVIYLPVEFVDSPTVLFEYR
jgi:hypothetical protein